MEESPVIGIYLGKTHSYVGVASRGNISVIKSDANYGIYTNIFVSYLNHTNRFEDSPIFEESEFELIDYSGRTKILFHYRGISKIFDFSAVCFLLFKQMKGKAENFVATSVKEAVITVPVEFNSLQRLAVKNAAKASGLNVLQLIHSPTAAVLAFDFHKTCSKKRNILILDLSDSVCGGVSVVTVDGKSVETKARVDWSDFGNSNMQDNIIYCLWHELHKILANYYRFNVQARTDAMDELMTLRSAKEMKLLIRNRRFVNDGNVTLKKWKTNVDDWPFDSILRLLKPIENFLGFGKMYMKSIHKVLLIGGPYRTLKLLQYYCFETPLNIPIGPDEVLAYGAAVQASILTEKMEPESESKIQNFFNYIKNKFSF